MNRSSLLMSFALAATSCAGVQACDVAAAFVVPAVITNHCMSNRTVDDARAQAQATIYYYENHLGLYTIETISDAYWVMHATDKQIENKLWWENKAVAALAGLCAVGLYTALKDPHSLKLTTPDIHVYWRPYSSYAMPYYRG